MASRATRLSVVPLARTVYTFEDFEADVAAAFAFLEQEHGMHRTFERAGVASWVTYENSLARVQVYYEIGSGVATTLEDRRYERKPLDTSRSFTLADLGANERLIERDSSCENVREQARYLETHGRSVLEGDFTRLHAKHDRLLAVTVANRAKSG